MSFWHRFCKKTPPADEAIREGICFWQVDMHSHLVPGIDDGVRTDEQALECLQKLTNWGLKKIVTTPHVSQHLFPNSSATLRAGQTSLQNLVARHGLDLHVEVAAEYLFDDFFLELIATDDLLSFGPERYVLFETGWAAAPLQLEETIFRLQTNGYTPVLAHPERYRYYFNHRDRLEKLHDAGCLFQLNWLSLSGAYGDRVRKQALALLRNRSIDFLGSDLHRPESLPGFSGFFTSSDFNLLEQQPLKNQSLL